MTDSQSADDTDTETDTTDTTLTLRRTFDAPRERVWRAFTDADELEQWFVPEGMTAEVIENDLAPGGTMSITWTDGETRIENEGYYVEVVEHERLVSGEETDEGTLRLTYEFRDADDGTDVVITQEFPDAVPEGASEGWVGMLDTLATRLDEQPAEVETGERTLTVRRTLDAPRERVFDAWTDPEQVDRWWGPEGFSTTTAAMDVRPGGIWRFEMVGPDGEVYPNRVEYDDVDRPSTLTYDHGEPDDPAQFHVTVRFEAGDADATTDLTMEMRFPSAADREAAVDFGADEGAVQTLGKLAVHLAGRNEAGGEA